ncbi:MAG TPA: 5'-nucleotidase C-terminal domain-containing protein [Terriglobia bacterium]|nr:5'-nucleotidase C-terminal domain-containing protein [Terriglobia bacterium]
MISAMVRVLLFVLTVFLLVVGLFAAEDTHVVIMHTNDIQGHLLPGPDGGGSARLSTVVRQMKPDLMLDAGNMFAGALIADAFQGEPVIEVMNAIGYDAATIGVNEFNFGVDALHDRARQANFPFLSANTSAPLPDIQDAAIYNAQGIRIALIGLTTEELTRTGHPQNVKYVDVGDVVQSLEGILPRVRDRVDFIVLLSHLTRPEEERVARAFPEIRLIVGAHEETELPARIGRTTIVGAGKFGKYVGVLDLSFNGFALKSIESRMISLDNVQPDPAIERLLAGYQTKLNDKLQMVVGQAAGDLSRSTAEESHVGNLVADAVRARTGTAIVLINAADARMGIPKGPITSRTLFEVLPSQNTLVTMRLSGAQIKRILGRTVMSVSGVRVKLHVNKPEGKRLLSARLEDGSPIRDKDFYTVTTNDFLLMGGDGFIEFADGVDVEDTGILIRDAVAEHIARIGTVAPRLDGRIQVSR